MRGGGEALGQMRLDGEGATGQFEDLVAGPAMEMVVVLLAGDFVAGGLAGKVDGDEPALFDQSLDVAVNGGDAEAGNYFRGLLQDFLWAHRAAGRLENLANGRLLPGVSLCRLVGTSRG